MQPSTDHRSVRNRVLCLSSGTERRYAECVRANEVTPTWLTDRRVALAMQHLPVLLAVGSGAVVLMRALQVADYQSTTAIAILAAGGLSGLILASVETVFIPIAPLVGLGLGILLFAGRPPSKSPWVVMTIALVWVAVVSIAIAATPVFIVLVSFVIAGFLLRVLRRPSKPNPDSASLIVLAFATIVGLGMLLTTSVPWLPVERITTSTETFNGYVLGSSGGWTAVLKDVERIVVEIRDGDIAARVPCTREAPLPQSITLVQLTFGSGVRGVPPPCT